MWKNDPDRMDRMRQKLQFGADLWGLTRVMVHDSTLLTRQESLACGLWRIHRISRRVFHSFRRDVTNFIGSEFPLSLVILKYLHPIDSETKCFMILIGNRKELPVPVAARSKALVFGRSPAEIVGSNPTRGMDICVL